MLPTRHLSFHPQHEPRDTDHTSAMHVRNKQHSQPRSLFKAFTISRCLNITPKTHSITTHATPAMPISDTQQALFRQWAEGTDFELNTSDTPKRQFNILAQLRGWVGGGSDWNEAWKECFNEVYIYRGLSE